MIYRGKKGVIINCGSILFRSYTLFIIFSDVRLTPRSWLRQSGSSADKAVKHLRNTKTGRKAIALYSRLSRFIHFFSLHAAIILSAEQAAVAIAAAAISFLIISSQRIEVSAQLTSFRLFETLCTVSITIPFQFANRTAWAIDGTVSPWSGETAESSAPVPTKSTLLSLPERISLTICEQTTAALHPQPEPPEFTSCSLSR